jgi:nucleoside 2-deoxyribosyltransferase
MTTTACEPLRPAIDKAQGFEAIKMLSARCPIWNTPADNPLFNDINNVYYDSPRAGGRYRINDRALALLEKNNPSPIERACLTTWLDSQREAGEKWPLIAFEFIGGLSSLRPLTTTARIEKALLYFNKRIRIGGKIAITPSTFPEELTDDFDLMVVTESPTLIELLALLEMLGEMGWLVERDSHMTGHNFALTAKGWLKIEELLTRLPDTSQAFVAMWFNQETEAVYEHGIKRAIEDAGYRPRRIDKKEHNNKIDDEIIAEIRRSKFLVADFTCEKEKVRGGVYFEAGFAMALPIPVIWTCSKGSFDDIHFDTRQYNHILWDTPEKLREALRVRIGAVVGEGPLIAR